MVIISSKLVLTLSILMANSADDKFMIYFLFFPENRIWYFMQRREFARNVISYFMRKIRKLFQIVVCWIFYPACLALGSMNHCKSYRGDCVYCKQCPKIPIIRIVNWLFRCINGRNSQFCYLLCLHLQTWCNLMRSECFLRLWQCLQ